MTSKRLFFNAMREDLRHRTWMIALSFLASVLAQPVMCLMSWDELTVYREYLNANGFSAERQVQELLLLYGRNTLGLCGLVAIGAAVVAGLSAFRFLFHKSSVDLYHSLPIKRRTLFCVCYLDGLLIWFVPFLVCLGMAAAVMGSFFRDGSVTAGAAGGFTVTAFSCILMCLAVFLLVYNLVLAAVMLSGNALNALVNIVVLGFGGICAWSVGYMFFELYMDTFGSRFWGAWGATYASPLFSAMAMLFRAADEMKVMLWHGEVLRILLINLGIAAALGLCAWILYEKRPSEHAEQGMRSRVVSTAVRALCAVGGGMCGWVLFGLLSESAAVVWGCFGAALGTVLAFGVLDVIFRMDFKAFFSHKIQMGVTLALTFLLCFGFYQDWLGYDAYLPDRDEVAEIAIYQYCFTNRDLLEEPLEKISLQDMDLIYPYLESVTAWQKKKGAYGQSGSAEDAEAGEDGARHVATQMIETKVTLKNGRTYYRDYSVPEQDKEVLLALLTSEEYVRQTYLVDEGAAENAMGRMTLSRGESQLAVGNAEPETLRSIIRAYNQDLTENPENAVTRQGRLLLRVTLNTWDRIEMEIYDDMSRTVEALKQAGYGKWVAVEASDVASVKLELLYGDEDYFAGRPVTEEERIAAARLTYGVYGEETEEELRARYGTAGDLQDTRQAELGGASAVEEGTEGISLFITEPEEIRELLEWVEYEYPNRSSALFSQERVRVTVTLRDGRVFPAYLGKGRLPEKYIYRFGQL